LISDLVCLEVASSCRRSAGSVDADWSVVCGCCFFWSILSDFRSISAGVHVFIHGTAGRPLLSFLFLFLFIYRPRLVCLFVGFSLYSRDGAFCARLFEINGMGSQVWLGSKYCLDASAVGRFSPSLGSSKIHPKLFFVVFLVLIFSCQERDRLLFLSFQEELGSSYILGKNIFLSYVLWLVFLFSCPIV